MFNFSLPEDLITNIEKIDRQHLTLVITVDNIIASLESGDNRDEVENLVNFLVSYVKVHFDEEESIMLNADYANFDAHKAEHDSFKLKVETMVKANQLSSDNPAILKSTVKEVRDWVINHVFNTDIEMAKAIKAAPKE